MDNLVDAELEVQISILRRVNELTKNQLANQIEFQEGKVRRLTRNKRIKQQTRDNRIAEARQIREACVAELVRQHRADELRRWAGLMRARSERSGTSTSSLRCSDLRLAPVLPGR